MDRGVTGPGGPGDRPSMRVSPVRWGLGTFAWLYAPIAVLAIASEAGGSSNQSTSTPATAVAIAAGIQYAFWFGGLLWASRVQGRGSLAADFGLTLELKRLWALVLGVGLAVALGAFVLPIVSLAGYQKQTVVDDLSKASGAKLAVLLIVAVLVAPVAEELLFRGLLLRSLRRRFTPELAVGLQALIFAVAHPLVDPRLGTVAIVPALFALGAISGIFAVRYGNLSASIPMHIGFNLLTAAQYALIFRHI